MGLSRRPPSPIRTKNSAAVKTIGGNVPQINQYQLDIVVIRPISGKGNWLRFIASECSFTNYLWTNGTPLICGQIITITGIVWEQRVVTESQKVMAYSKRCGSFKYSFSVNEFIRADLCLQKLHLTRGKTFGGNILVRLKTFKDKCINLQLYVYTLVKDIGYLLNIIANSSKRFLWARNLARVQKID